MREKVSLVLRKGGVAKTPCTCSFRRENYTSDGALLKALYLSTFEATKKWSMPIRNWGKIYGELAIMYENRIPEY